MAALNFLNFTIPPVRREDSARLQAKQVGGAGTALEERRMAALNVLNFTLSPPLQSRCVDPHRRGGYRPRARGLVVADTSQTLSRWGDIRAEHCCA